MPLAAPIVQTRPVGSVVSGIQSPVWLNVQTSYRMCSRLLTLVSHQSVPLAAPRVQTTSGHSCLGRSASLYSDEFRPTIERFRQVLQVSHRLVPLAAPIVQTRPVGSVVSGIQSPVWLNVQTSYRMCSRLLTLVSHQSVPLAAPGVQTTSGHSCLVRSASLYSDEFRPTIERFPQ